MKKINLCKIVATMSISFMLLGLGVSLFLVNAEENDSGVQTEPVVVEKEEKTEKKDNEFEITVKPKEKEDPNTKGTQTNPTKKIVVKKVKYEEPKKVEPKREKITTYEYKTENTRSYKKTEEKPKAKRKVKKDKMPDTSARADMKLER